MCCGDPDMNKKRIIRIFACGAGISVPYPPDAGEAPRVHKLMTLAPAAAHPELRNGIRHFGRVFGLEVTAMTLRNAYGCRAAVFALAFLPLVAAGEDAPAGSPRASAAMNPSASKAGRHARESRKSTRADASAGSEMFMPPFVFLMGSSGGSSISPVAGADPQQCARMAGRYVNERLGVWQERLKLAGWNISIIMAHSSELKPDTLGNIRWDAESKSAVIRVLDASEYQIPCREMLNDMEFTVVHELIHLELSSLPRSEASRGDEEFAVNQISEALLRLDRGR